MEIVDRIASGEDLRDALFLVCPGGGKSGIPLIFGKLIDLGFADALCWICPRKSLQHQAESNFIDPTFRVMFSHSLTIRASTNEPDPCKGLNGFVTTLQALGLDSGKTILTEIRSKRYILVIDETHHLEEDSVWEEAMTPVYEAAKYRVKLTGTLERNSGKKVSFTEYEKSTMGTQPSMDPNGGVVVTYTRRDALAEKAIIPLSFHFNDASVEWIESDGKRKSYGSLRAVKPQDRGKALYTAIETEYSTELIDKALDHWLKHKEKNPTAKLLVVCSKISNAKQAIDYLRIRFHYSDIATSDESAAAQEAIGRFKSGELKILVTVGICYEGLDVPEISHIVSLTNIRSSPWISQMVARAVRVNKNLPYRQQKAYVFTMADQLMYDQVEILRAEQLPFVKYSKPKDEEQRDLFDEEPTEPIEDYAPYDIEPVGSAIAGGRTIVLGDHWNQSQEYDPSGEVPETPSETERRLRFDIERSVRSFTQAYKYEHDQVNKELLLHFGKRRKSMTIPELQSVLDYVKRTYAANGSGRRRAAPRQATRYYGPSEVHDNT